MAEREGLVSGVMLGAVLMGLASLTVMCVYGAYRQPEADAAFGVILAVLLVFFVLGTPVIIYFSRPPRRPPQAEDYDDEPGP